MRRPRKVRVSIAVCKVFVELNFPSVIGWWIFDVPRVSVAEKVGFRIVAI